ncbi:MAG TPA: glycosyltransferase [Limnobacter sp.]|nr:glycosyltransferase [Limnobacter sp.]
MICLNMIVKNETRILERCLNALVPYVSCYVIGDTGSTDGTQQLIRDFFSRHGIPGEIHEFEFRNFEYARNRALELAKASSLNFEYLLLCDADMELVADDPDWHRKLDQPVYRVEQRAGIAYWNVRLLSRRLNSRYVGVTHEYLDTGAQAVNFRGFHYIDHACGSNRVDKFLRDAQLLEEALKTDPGNQRYWFYLAQSWRDANENQKALDCYRHRVKLGGWLEETWFAAFQVGVLLERLNKPEEEIAAAYLQAYRLRPQRAESMHALARYYRMKVPESAAMSYLYSLAAVNTPRPDDILFVDESVYTWRSKDELSIAAYWIGRYEESIRYATEILLANQCQMDDRIRILSNLLFAVVKRNSGLSIQKPDAITAVEIELGNDLDSFVSSLAYALLHHPALKEVVFCGDAAAAAQLLPWTRTVGQFFKVVHQGESVQGSTAGQEGKGVIRYRRGKIYSIAEVLTGQPS